MKRQKLFSRRHNRVRNKTKRVRRSHWLELLEPRSMMAATPLATFNDMVATAGQSRTLSLTLSGATDPIVLSLQTSAASGSTFDAAAVQIRNSAGTTITPLSSQNGI